MSGLESLINEGVQEGMRLGTQAFAEGGQVQGYADGGAVQYVNINGHQVPIYSADDIKWNPAQPMTGGYYDDWGFHPETGTTAGFDFAPDLAARYGDLYGFGQADNWNTLGGDESGFMARLKVGDKEGANFRYTMQDGRWVPQYVGSGEWNTNNDWTNPALMMAAFATLGAGAAGAFGSGIQSALGGAMPAAEGAAAAGAGAGAGASAGSMGTTWGLVDTSLSLAPEMWAPAAGQVAGSVAGAAAGYNPYAITAAELGAPVETYLGAAPVAGEGGMATLGSAAGAYAGQLPASYIDAINTAVNTGIPIETAITNAGLTMEGLANSWSTVGPSLGTRATDIANRIGSWALNNPGQAATVAGTIGSLVEGLGGGGSGAGGGGGGAGGGGGPAWNGPIPQYTAQQTLTQAPAGYRPGFSPEHVYLRTDIQGRPTGPATVNVPGSGGGLPAIAPPPGVPPPLPPYTGPAMIDPDESFAGGGHVQGQGDGMSDSIPATIGGQQPAALSNNEFVVPADVVADIGNGSSEAGAQVLYAMMDRVRQARHGTNKQPPEIDPEQLLPV